jgi:hypothetical protein
VGWLIWLALSAPIFAIASDDHLLPEGPNKILVQANCTVCHSAQLVSQNRLTRAGWEQAIAWMQATQGLWPLTPDIKEPILDYLVTHFGPSPEGEVQKPLMRARVNPLPRSATTVVAKK